MTMTFPAFFGDPQRKVALLAELAATDWSEVHRLEELWRIASLPPASWAAPLHDASGFPADILHMAAAIHARLPAGRRGRFVLLLFDAATAGADLAPVAQRFLAQVAGDARASDWALPVLECAPALERLHPDWQTCADLLVETVAGA